MNIGVSRWTGLFIVSPLNPILLSRHPKSFYLSDRQLTDREPMNTTRRNLRLHQVKERFSVYPSQCARLFFNSKMVVTEQFWSYGFMSYIAETGGFVGLFLGYSLLQLELLLIFCSKRLGGPGIQQRRWK